MTDYDLDSYVLVDLSETCRGATSIRASIESINPGSPHTVAPLPTYLVATADLRNNGQRSWVRASKLSPAPAIDEAPIEFSIGSQALRVATLDSPSWSPLALDEVERIPDKRTNRYRAPLRIALEVLFALEDCPAHVGRRGGDYAELPAETTAVRKSARRLRRTIEVFYRDAEAEGKGR